MTDDKEERMLRLTKEEWYWLNTLLENESLMGKYMDKPAPPRLIRPASELIWLFSSLEHLPKHTDAEYDELWCHMVAISIENDELKADNARYYQENIENERRVRELLAELERLKRTMERTKAGPEDGLQGLGDGPNGEWEA